MATPLTTLANLKEALKIPTGQSADDAQLNRIIDHISQWLLTQINRGALIAAGYQEQRNGQGSDLINTKYYPITAVATVLVDGIAIPASPDGVQPGYVFDDFSIWLICHRFKRGRGNVNIAYTAGYAVVPPDIERAVLDQSVFVYRRLPKMGTITESMNGVVTASFSQKDCAPGVDNIIANYRDRALVGL